VRCVIISEKEVEMCPKCGGEMMEGRSLTADYLLWSIDVHVTKKKLGGVTRLSPSIARTVVTLNSTNK